MTPTYPIAELFDSIQGEGVYTGVRMQFIRLVGCNVGKHPTSLKLTQETQSRLLPVLSKANERGEHTVCTSVFGEHFMCDTDYRKFGSYTVEGLLDLVQCGRICITGGEPFLHDLRPLVLAAHSRGIQVHIETSGTLPILADLAAVSHVVCSPKKGFLETNRWNVHEWKFVVSAHNPLSNEDLLEEIVHTVRPPYRDDARPIYVQPVNGVHGVDHSSLERCLALVQLNPMLRLSVQLHKLLNVR